MTNLVSAAQTARQNLAQGLSALQQPGAPPALMEAAQPIAEAMSALHKIEASQGASAAEFAPVALAAARHALAGLQSHQHPAALQAVESVASSLNLIHQLAKASVAPPPLQAQAPRSPPALPQTAQASPPALPPQQPAQKQAAPAPMNSARPLPDVKAPAGTPRVDVALGAHSPTNFYKGLSGNDIIDAGGIFVATYQIPDVGQTLVLRMSMPGGYEFEVLGTVRWTREAPLSGTDSPPGFGAQFTDISPEARQLVYRYVRNREPLFYDDL